MAVGIHHVHCFLILLFCVASCTPGWRYRFSKKMSFGTVYFLNSFSLQTGWCEGDFRTLGWSIWGDVCSVLFSFRIPQVINGDVNLVFVFCPSRTKSGNTEPTFMFLSSLRYWRTGRTRSTSVNFCRRLPLILHGYRVIISPNLFCQQEGKGNGLKLKTPPKCCGATSPCRLPTSRLSRRAAWPVTEPRWSR